MPQLQLHMLRVAGVASIICDNFRKDIDKESIVTSCLLHDMGSIIKFELKNSPNSLKPKGLDYWTKVKEEYINKWGKTDHKATLNICKDIGIKKEILSTLKYSGFDNTAEIFKSNDIGLKIFKYSDLRVMPDRVGSLKERLEEAKKRYLARGDDHYTLQQFNKFAPMWRKIEEQIFYLTDIKPENITDRKVMPLVLKLKKYNIKTK